MTAKQTRLIYRALTTILVLSIITGFALAKLEFDDKKHIIEDKNSLEKELIQIKHDVEYHQHEQKRIIDSVIHSVEIQRITVYDTNTYLVPKESSASIFIQMYSNLEIGDTTLIYFDHDIFDLQNDTGAEIAPWLKSSVGYSKVVYYDRDNKGTARRIKRLVQKYVDGPVDLHLGHERPTSLIEVYLIRETN